MEKLKRTDRLVVLSTLLTKNPNALFSLSDLATITGAAKSTISEDLTIVKEVFSLFSLGELSSIAGAAGGVVYKPVEHEEATGEFLEKLAERFSEPDRIVPGGFIYMTDVIYDPRIISRIGEIFFTKFCACSPDYIVTVETKGIPIAMMTARSFNVPLVIIRDSGRVTEGTSVSINYVSGSSQRIQTMSLSRRALPTGAKVLIIDDFMKGGGTAQGMHNLMKEFNAEVLGTGVVIATREPQDKLIKDYYALLELISIHELSKNILIKPFIENKETFLK
ncbi:pur operon repressor [Candidatus Formimonas warabiya]|uniref:Pur operon repressor n=1 Tax=Formimonas warabiya TaxID=1761012 RepID=A0A3G1KX16_FORW1|nr:pur operon repressor [Candidatus Formimonas warabiya]ATW26981.1 pur operon repressor [Candidatus Formimonas warabiya]